ncbi:hypothetical protein [Paenibacillus xanthanilyticus]|uniref:Uncharacterized protein n=1 Tax=Paenibacillus xanthanilyticus TaxID=1783531 RepID=A0ABV8K6S0_9BACL
MKECLFHFKLIKDGQTKEYRTLAMIPEDKQPEISDFIASFEELGYKVDLANERELIFRSRPGEEPYKLDITKMEIKGAKHDDEAFHDGELRAILEHLVTR